MTRRIGIILLGLFAALAAHPISSAEPDETPVSCLLAQAHLLEFSAPEKTWAFFLKSLRAGERRAALSAFLQGDLKVGLSQVLNSMDAEKMRAMADSFGPLTEKKDIGGGLQEYLVIRTHGAQSTGAIVEFEYHPNCGGWRIAAM